MTASVVVRPLLPVTIVWITLSVDDPPSPMTAPEDGSELEPDPEPGSDAGVGTTVVLPMTTPPLESALTACPPSEVICPGVRVAVVPPAATMIAEDPSRVVVAATVKAEDPAVIVSGLEAAVVEPDTCVGAIVVLPITTPPLESALIACPASEVVCPGLRVAVLPPAATTIAEDPPLVVVAATANAEEPAVTVSGPEAPGSPDSEVLDAPLLLALAGLVLVLAS